MTKVKMIRMYSTADVPDHLIEEIGNLVADMGSALSGCCLDKEPNLILSAFNYIHATMICALVTEGYLPKAAEIESAALIKNVEHISGLKIFNGGEDGDK